MQKITHPWNLKPKEAIALQKKLSGQVIRKSTIRQTDVVSVAGVDTWYHDDIAYAAAVTLNVADLTTLEYAQAKRSVAFPYVPGLLSFREGPVILEALRKIKSAPDLLIVDGHGIAHPRRFGIACHIGLLANIPTIGCAKTRLWGTYQEPEPLKGSFSYLMHKGEPIGAAVRTRSNVKPVFVSSGHLVDLEDSIRFVLKCCRRYRLPETTRRADQLSRKQITPL
jgi:deoxyribonuclease V